MGTARTAATPSTSPAYPSNTVENNAHVLALAERFASYTALMRGSIGHAADVGDADTAAVYTDISRGADTHLRFLEAHLHQ
jgi:starvation-inducible DNA-binding protein